MLFYTVVMESPNLVHINLILVEGYVFSESSWQASMYT